MLLALTLWLGKLGAGPAHPSGGFSRAKLSKQLLQREKGLDRSLARGMSTRLSCQGAGADARQRCEQARHRAAAVGCQSPSRSPRELPVLRGPALTRLVGARSCSVAESCCSFWLPPESPPAGPASPAPRWCFRRSSLQAEVGREALFLQIHKGFT